MTESIPHSADILLVGINISTDSANNGALWSSQRSPWNVWKKAGIFKDYPDDLTSAVKCCNLEKYTNGFQVGFTDLVDIAETNSNRVKIENTASEELMKKIEDNKVKNVVLMGDRVIQTFFSGIHNDLCDKWKKMQKNKVSYGKHKKKYHPEYGFIGKMSINAHEVAIYGMPFPTTVPIKDKYKFYEKMVSEIKNNDSKFLY